MINEPGRVVRIEDFAEQAEAHLLLAKREAAAHARVSNDLISRVTHRSEVQSERELYLPVGTEPDRALHGAVEDAEVSGRRCRQRLTRLDLVVFGPERVWERRRRVREVRVIEEVEHLAAKLQIHSLPHMEALGKCEVDLVEVRPVQQAALEIPKVPGLGIANAAGSGMRGHSQEKG